MKKLTIPCQFGNQRQPVDFYVGQPKSDNHPIQNQSHWLSSERGGVVPGEIMDSLQRLHDLSKKNHVPFEELCSYAIESANTDSAEAAPPAEEVLPPVEDNNSKQEAIEEPPKKKLKLDSSNVPNMDPLPVEDQPIPAEQPSIDPEPSPVAEAPMEQPASASAEAVQNHDALIDEAVEAALEQPVADPVQEVAPIATESSAIEEQVVPAEQSEQAAAPNAAPTEGASIEPEVVAQTPDEPQLSNEEFAAQEALEERAREQAAELEQKKKEAEQQAEQALQQSAMQQEVKQDAPVEEQVGVPIGDTNIDKGIEDLFEEFGEEDYEGDKS